MKFSLEGSSSYGRDYLSLLCLHPPISSESVGGIREFIFQIPSMDEVLMGYLVTYQVDIMMYIVN